MFKFIFIIATILKVIVFVKAQSADTTWCDIKVTNSPKIPVINNNQQYEALIERNDLIKLSSEEIKEYYDGKNNVGIAETTFNGQTIKTFSYYDKNELLYVFDNQCQASRLDLTYSLTPFFMATINGKETLVSPLNVILNAHDLEVGYIGSSQIRGINVVNWETCFYSKSENATIKATLSYTDKSKWVPASGDTEDSVPVQIKLEKKKLNGFIDTDTYSIFGFREMLSLKDEKKLTAPGIYCSNKEKGKEVPAVPRHFQFMIETTTAILNIGSTSDTFEYFDYDAKLFKIVNANGKTLNTAVHDFATGLVYKIEEVSGNCSITRINSEDVDAEGSIDGSTVIRNPEQFFDLDQSDYQYSGKRLINGVKVDTWIGNRKFHGSDTKFEWDYLENSWNRTDTLNRYVPTPVRLTIYIEKKINGTELIQQLPISINFFNFRTSDSIDTHHDISKCNQLLARKTFQLSFNVDKDMIELVKNNKDSFKLGAYKSVAEKAMVANIRLTNFDVTFDESHIFFIFSINEKSKIYGDVEVPLNDVSLEDAVFHLTLAIKNGDLKINFSPIVDKFINRNYVLTPDAGSFGLIEDQEEGFVTLTKVVDKQGYTPATVGILSFLVAVVGLILSLTLTVLQKNKKINMPCY